MTAGKDVATGLDLCPAVAADGRRLEAKADISAVFREQESVPGGGSPAHSDSPDYRH